jgi:hypothetical protein
MQLVELRGAASPSLDEQAGRMNAVDVVYQRSRGHGSHPSDCWTELDIKDVTRLARKSTRLLSWMVDDPDGASTTSLVSYSAFFVL